MISFTGNVLKIKQKLFELDPQKEYDVEIKQHREKRSANANSYLWLLVNEIAEAINRSKEYVYFEMLKRYGVSELVAVSNKVVAENFFKYYEVNSNNGNWIWYRIYKGSSQYDTKEMSVLLNGVIEECKEMGLPTKDDLEIERLIKEWEGERYA